MNLKKVFAFLLIFAGISSCELVGSIDDITPPHKLTDENIITNVQSAEAGVAGVYRSWRNMNIGWMRHMLNALTGTEPETNIYGINGFKSNDVKNDNPGVENNYIALYYVVNNASSFLHNLAKKTNLPGLTPERRAEMEGEAKYSRAQANLMLLRQYGEFFDITSTYGILLYPDNVPIRDNAAIKRSTVQETYDNILADLDHAIKNAPEKNDPSKVSRVTAKALKARVLLYMKNFTAAAALAQEVINEAEAAGYVLEEDFKQMFHNSFESKEMLFALYSTYPDESYEGGLWYTSLAGPTTQKIAKSIAGTGKTDKRFVQTYEKLDPNNTYVVNNKYNFIPFVAGKQDSHFYIRLAEMYFIIAESQARLKHYDAARAALKSIICLDRAGYTPAYVDAITNNQLLEMILKHKWLEFFTENNEEWFDLVRYHKWDGFAITPYYVESDQRTLLPIPRKALTGNNLLEQNPGYPAIK